jgi:hypothetical protein
MLWLAADVLSQSSNIAYLVKEARVGQLWLALFE